MRRDAEGFILVVRVIADLPDQASATAFAGAVEAKAATCGRVVEIETKRYWKIPEWFEVSLCLAPEVEVGFAFDGVAC